MPGEKSLADYFTLLNSGAAAVTLLYFPTCMKLTCLRMCINGAFYTEHFIALEKVSEVTLPCK